MQYAVCSMQYAVCSVQCAVCSVQCAGGVWKGNAKFVKQLEKVQMTAAKNILECLSTTSGTVLRAELGRYPFQTNRNARKLKWQY